MTRKKAEEVQEVHVVMHGKQQEFYDDPHHIRGFCGGVGSGKSWCGAYDIISKAEPKTLNAVVAPTYDMLSQATLRSFIDMAEKMGVWDWDHYNKTEKVAMLKTGAEFIFRSCDKPAGLRGFNGRRVWMDECQKAPSREAYDILRARLRHGGKLGYLSCTFTPAGKEHWTYSVFGTKTDPNVSCYHCTTKDNPFLEAEFYEAQLSGYGTGQGGQLRAKQELGGEFVCVEGAEWGPEYFGPEIWVDEFPTSEEELRVVHLDSSKGVGGKSGDYSCFAKVKWCNGLLYVEFDMDNTRNTDDMASAALEIQRTFKPMWFGIEAEFGIHFLGQNFHDRAQAQNILMPLALVPTGGIQKEVRIRRLGPYITGKMLRFINNESTKIGVSQLEVFPHGEHDDAPDSAESAIRLLCDAGVWNY